jgi:hypothetical protein
VTTFVDRCKRPVLPEVQAMRAEARQSGGSTCGFEYGDSGHRPRERASHKKMTNSFEGLDRGVPGSANGISECTADPACFVCGEENPHGLHLLFQAEGRARTRHLDCVRWLESYKGIIHGGSSRRFWMK